MKWGGFMDGMGIFEQKNEERKEERKQEGRRRGREVERERERKVAQGERERSVGLREKSFERIGIGSIFTSVPVRTSRCKRHPCCRAGHDR
jgi:hypothetical protein